MKHHLLTILLSLFAMGLAAQNTSVITGNFQSNGNFFIKDSAIGAAATPQYENLKFGAESWLNLNYSNWGFDIGVRVDLFNNSNLLNPNGGVFSGQGIGRWYVHKSIDKFDLSGGYLYDQIGSGIIFRAYEERSLLIDNALFGVKAGYSFNDNWKVRAFAGQEKRQFSTYGANVRGLALEGFIKADSSNLSFAPGVGVVARAYDKETIDRIANTLGTYPLPERFSPQYNTYAATVYNTMTAGDFTWFVEGAYKTPDVLNDAANLAGAGNSEIQGKLYESSGYTVYSSLAWAKKGLGVTLEGKRTKDFSFRNDPFVVGVQGPVNFLPPMAKQNTYRLTTRFSPATQELGEQALQLDVRYAINKKFSVNVNIADIQDLNNKELYREITPEFTFKYKRKWQLLAGVQVLKYNIEIYQGKKGYVDAVTPYAEWLYKFTPRKSLRVEAQYLETEDEFGSWAFALAELAWAPHWLLYVSDMYKVKHADPESLDPDKVKYDGLHYPTVGIVYTQRANRFELAFVKQVEGINCAGGICRYEPTFSGFRAKISSSF
ncbi:MAG: hypothetical protein H6565_16405 [Lewinellaceae bacterium]|nr:hypothetical protein [Lewinellaceae bacterium]